MLRQQRDPSLRSTTGNQDSREKLAALPRTAPLEPSAETTKRSPPSQAVLSLGVWQIQGGAARIVIRLCGPNLCGLVNWAIDGGDLGTQVLRDMKPVGPNRWEGISHDPATGQRDASNINLGADDTLRVEGCVVDTLCRGQAWTRVTGQGRPAAR
jgi:uncharacterized protein (DUF2147 family)